MKKSPRPATSTQAGSAAAGQPQVNGDSSSGPPQSRGGPLNLLAADIAKAIDHDASVELWERHRRGETNLFTRRLYTLQGQQTFDEIRRKYQRDQEFSAAVDRYITDFEKLLAEVNRNNKDPRGRRFLPDLGHRQGLHDACPCKRPLRLRLGRDRKLIKGASGRPFHFFRRCSSCLRPD